MISSIRTFLLINLLLSVALVTSLAIIGNLVLSHKDIETQLDAELFNVSLHMGALFGTNLKSYHLQDIQNNLRQLQKQSIADLHKDPQYISIHPLEFQIWNQQNQLLLRSPGAPSAPFSNGQPGLSTLSGEADKEDSWRVNTLRNNNNHITVMLAERIDDRRQLENRLTQDSMLIMLIAYPLLGLLIWIIVGRALHPIKKVAEEVSARAPSYLKPVDMSSVPMEIIPLVEELNHLFTRLQEAFDREKRFTADAAHELKTPLAGIRTQTQVALCTDNHEDRNNALRKILAGVNRSAHVVQQLLTLSRMVPEATIAEPIKVVLAREASEIAALLAPEAIAKDIDLELLNPDSKASIIGNGTAISILIRNLVDNAIRYTPPGGFVRINVGATTNQVIFSVVDSGPGIPEELRERVFERFYRGADNTSPGSGLGLAIVQQIAKLHQAQVILKTPESGHGLEVQVIFRKA